MALADFSYIWENNVFKLWFFHKIYDWLSLDHIQSKETIHMAIIQLKQIIYIHVYINLWPKITSKCPCYGNDIFMRHAYFGDPSFFKNSVL